MRIGLTRSLMLLTAAVTVNVARASAQSDSFCANAADSSRVIRTGPVRMVAQAFGDLRVCFTSSGFTDSAEAHPREWPSFSSSVVFETIRPSDARRLESNRERGLLTINGQPRAVDSAAAAWREQVYHVIELRWNIVSLREQQAGLENDIISTRRQSVAMTAEIDTIQRQSMSLESSIAALRAAEDAGRFALSREERAEGDIRAQLSTARSALASLANNSSPSAQAQYRQAQQRVDQLERLLTRQEAAVRDAERRLLNLDAGRRIGALALEQRNLNTDARLALLRVRLATLDADARIEGLQGQLRSLRAEERIARLEGEQAQAVTRLREMLAR